MNAAVEWANGLAGHWARGMWPVLWQTAALAVIVGLVVLCNRRMSPALRFWLWMLVPMRLLVMPLIVITLPVLANPPAAQLEPAAAPPSFISQAPAEAQALDLTAQPTPPAEPPSIPVPRQVRASIWTWLMAGWIAGIGFFALRLARGWLRMKTIAGQARENSDARVRDCAHEAAVMLGLRKMPRIMTAAEGVSPFVLGFFRPVVVLPAELADHVSADELRAVLAHEFAHVRRRDALVGWVLACSDVIYFFNPVVHLVKRAIIFERERACDEQVLALAQAPRAVYARALLSATALTRPAAARLSCAPVLLESGQHLERRLKSIADERRPRAALSRTAQLALLAIAALALPGITCTQRSAGLPVEQLSRTEMLRLVADGAENSLSRILDAKGTAIRKCVWQDGGHTEQEIAWFWKDGKLFEDVKVIDEVEADGNRRSQEEDESRAHGSLVTPEMYARIVYKNRFCDVHPPEWAKQDVLTEVFEPPVIYGYQDAGKPLKQVVDEHQKDIQIVSTVLNGRRVFMLTYSTPIGREMQARKLWVDPERGFSFVRIERKSATFESTVENDIRQDENTVWFPVEGHVKVRQLVDKSHWVQSWTMDWKLKEYAVNVGLDDKTFSLADHLKPGMHVTDSRLDPPRDYEYDATGADVVLRKAENDTGDAEMVKQCARNLEKIVKGIINYQSLNNDKLPPSLAELFPKYLDYPKVLICPADKAPMKIRNGLPCSYRYIGNGPWREITVVFFIAYDRTPHDGGRNVAYFDGHVHHASEQDFQNALAKLDEQLKPLMAKPDFPGDRDRVKAFCEDKDFPEEATPPAPQELSLRQYDVADLVSSMGGTKLLETIIDRTGRENWDTYSVLANDERTTWSKLNSGGDSERMIYLTQNWLMVVNQLEAMHHKLEILLAELRAGTPGAPAHPEPGAASPLDQKIEAISLPGVALMEAVEILRTQIPVRDMNFVIDPHVAQDRTPIVVDLRNVTLAQTLEAALKGLKLTFVLSDNVIYISTKEGCAAYAHYVEPPIPEGQAGNLRMVLDSHIKAVGLPGVSLPEAVEILKNFKHLPITIDPALLAKPEQLQVTLELRDVPLRVVLKNIVVPNGLEYTYVGEGIVIKEKAPGTWTLEADELLMAEPSWANRVNFAAANGTLILEFAGIDARESVRIQVHPDRVLVVDESQGSRRLVTRKLTLGRMVIADGKVQWPVNGTTNMSVTAHEGKVRMESGSQARAIEADKITMSLPGLKPVSDEVSPLPAAPASPAPGAVRVTPGMLGAVVQEVTPDMAKLLGLSEAKGALVALVYADFPAAKAGVKAGDVIVRYDGREVENAAGLREMVAVTAPDTEVKLGIIRNGKEETLTARVGKLVQVLNFGPTTKDM
jgi:prepilin-type processing-associated H-X9-DG protein